MSDHDRSVRGADDPSVDQPFHVPAELPVLPLRDTVLFPNSFMPLAVARESSVRLIDEAVAAGRMIAVFTQREASEDEPRQDDLHADRHRQPHPQDVQAARRQPAHHRAGPGARAARRR